jgi:predicted patatin/cPLA2 family phospholipase
MSIDKTALIIEGGGSRGVFSFGVIDTFIKNQFDPFNLYIGVSNGAVVLNWFLIKEKDYNLEKMLFSANKKYVNYLNFF